VAYRDISLHEYKDTYFAPGDKLVTWLHDPGTKKKHVSVLVCVEDADGNHRWAIDEWGEELPADNAWRKESCIRRAEKMGIPFAALALLSDSLMSREEFVTRVLGETQ